jgi:hypothetical protein
VIFAGVKLWYGIFQFIFSSSPMMEASMLIPIALGNPLLLWFRFPHLSASDPSPAYYVAFPSPRLADTLQKTPVAWHPYPSFRESTVASQLSVHLPFPFPLPLPLLSPLPLSIAPATIATITGVAVTTISLLLLHQLLLVPPLMLLYY